MPGPIVIIMGYDCSTVFFTTDSGNLVARFDCMYLHYLSCGAAYASPMGLPLSVRQLVDELRACESYIVSLTRLSVTQVEEEFHRDFVPVKALPVPSLDELKKAVQAATSHQEIIDLVDQSLPPKGEKYRRTDGEYLSPSDRNRIDLYELCERVRQEHRAPGSLCIYAVHRHS